MQAGLGLGLELQGQGQGQAELGLGVRECWEGFLTIHRSYIYGVYTTFLAGKSLNIRPYTVHIYGSG